jgi:transcriptional regulator with XRE-family HTH domain
MTIVEGMIVVDMDRDDRPEPDFAALFREYIGRQQLSYQDFAELAGLSKSYVSLVAQGKRKPRPLVAERMGQALGLKPREIARFIKAAGPDLRTRGGRSPRFLASLSRPGPDEALLIIEPIEGDGGRTPKVEVYSAGRRGVVMVRAEMEGAKPGYLRVQAKNGPDFDWIKVTSKEPLQQLPIHADSAVLGLGVEDEGGKIRLVHEVTLGPRQFLGL